MTTKTTTITLRVNSEDKRLMQDFAKFKGRSLTQFMRDAAIEKIEDELDLRDAREALAAYDADPVSYSLEEIEEKYA